MRHFPHSLLVLLVLSASAPVAAQHLRTGISSQQSGGTWYDLIRQRWYFDAPEGRVDSLLLDVWDEENGVWVGQGRLTSDYSVPDQVIQLEELWDEDLQTWVLDERNTVYLLPDGSDNEVLLERWDGAQWQPLEQVLFSYGANDSLEERLTRTWNGVSWVAHARSWYSYNVDDQEIALRKDTMGTDWVAIEVDSSAYNAEGLRSTKVHWELLGGVLTEFTRSAYTYNEDGEHIATDTDQLLLGLGIYPIYHQEYEPVGDGLRNIHDYNNTNLLGEPVWNYVSRLLFTEVTTNAAALPATMGLHVFPNPSEGNFTIQDPGITGRAHVEVLDPTGRLVYTDRLALYAGGSMQLALAGRLSAGTYVLRLSTDTRTYDQRILVR